MCGIAGILSLSSDSFPVGTAMLAMLRALYHRGPDSAGVAVYSAPSDSLVLRVKCGEERIDERLADTLVEVVGRAAPLYAEKAEGAYLRLEIMPDVGLDDLASAIAQAGGELVSAGRALEIMKQVGSPDGLEHNFGLSRLRGTHALGHTRMSTESRIDLSHSQPFWASGTPDVAIVHNGHITNYHLMRRRYEEQGVRFYTDNDSEIIGVYLRDRMQQGDGFAEALERSLTDFDGSFCFLAASQHQMAFVKDPFSFKPLMVGQTEEFVAIATEEVAIRAAFGEGFRVREPAARSLLIWDVPGVAVS